jgi:ammonia channel protein AmtB
MSKVEKDIKREKTKESLSVFMVIGLVIISIIAGYNFSAAAAIIGLLAGIVLIWKFYYK